MKTIKVKDVIIGEGMPKICVPLIPERLEEISAAAAKAGESGCDIVEWRLDRLRKWTDNYFGTKREAAIEDINTGLELIRRETQAPIILTLRSADEGGFADLRRRDYYSVIRDIIDECCPDIIDIEGIDQENEDWFDMVEFIANMAHENGIAVILSNHDFDKTPPMEEIVKRLCVMAEMGADIPKVAYMPRKPEDVDTVIHAAAIASEYFDKPFIALSMSAEGLPSRICNGQSGTAITFAAASGKSAPGQVDVSEMQELLRRFYNK